VIVPLELLVNVTLSGATPEVGLPVNCATGTLDGTIPLTSFEYPLSTCDASYDVAAK
jgi:hypothetical protein